MNTLQDYGHGITRDATLKYLTGTGGTPDNVLATSSQRSDKVNWEHAIDEMLKWRSNASPFDPEDQPEAGILDAAIDYAMDMIEEDGPSPSSIIPSGNGRISMEWNHGLYTVIVEFIGPGVASYTQFFGRQVESRGRLARNPKSRKLELRG